MALRSYAATEGANMTLLPRVQISDADYHAALAESSEQLNSSMDHRRTDANAHVSVSVHTGRDGWLRSCSTQLRRLLIRTKRTRTSVR